MLDKLRLLNFRNQSGTESHVFALAAAKSLSYAAEAPWSRIVVTIALGLAHISVLRGRDPGLEQEAKRKLHPDSRDFFDSLRRMYGTDFDLSHDPVWEAGFKPLLPPPQGAKVLNETVEWLAAQIPGETLSSTEYGLTLSEIHPTLYDATGSHPETRPPKLTEPKQSIADALILNIADFALATSTAETSGVLLPFEQSEVKFGIAAPAEPLLPVHIGAPHIDLRHMLVPGTSAPRRVAATMDPWCSKTTQNPVPVSWWESAVALSLYLVTRIGPHLDITRFGDVEKNPGPDEDVC